MTRIENRAIADDGGQWNAIASTLFPAPWCEDNDVLRLEGAFDSLASDGPYDGYRSMTGAAGSSWTERMSPMSQAVSQVQRMVDRGYDKFGLRSMHCIFGDGANAVGAETPEKRVKLVDDFAEMLPGREHKFLALEMVNENENGMKLPIPELRFLGARLQSKTSVPVIYSRMGDPTNYPLLYENSGARLATGHYERDESDDGGKFEFMMKPEEFEPLSGGPTACVNGESKWVGASGKSEDDPMRLCLSVIMSFVGKNAAHVCHWGAGKRLGTGVEPSISSTLRGHVQWNAVNDGLRAFRENLPDGMANWRKYRGHWADSPINFIDYRNDVPGENRKDNGPFDDGTIFKAYVSVSPDGKWMVSPMLKVMKPITITVPRLMRVVDPRTFDTLQEGNGKFIVNPRPNPEGDGLLLIGEML